MAKVTEGIPIAKFIFSKEDLQELVDEKVKEFELDIQAIRNKAIDDFAEQLRLRCLDSVYKEVSMYAIFEIAQQLKEGAVDD